MSIQYSIKIKSTPLLYQNQLLILVIVQLTVELYLLGMIVGLGQMKIRLILR